MLSYLRSFFLPIYSYLSYPYFEDLGVQTMDSSVSEWTPVVRKQPKNEGKNDFVKRYMSIIYTLLHDSPSIYNIKIILATKP